MPDYAALARQAGAIDSKPAAIDYGALAKQAGAIASQPAAAQPKSTFDTIVDSVLEFGKGAASQFNPIPMVQGMAEMTRHPIDAARNIIQAQANTGGAAMDSFKQGNYVDGVRHAVNYLLPMIGPQIDEMGNRAAAAQTPEELAHVAGEATGFGLVNALPDAPIVRQGARAVVSKAKQLTPAAPKITPKMQRAIEFADREGIPTDAGTRSQNKFVQGAQALVDHSPGGAMVAQGAKAAADEAFPRVLNKIADQVHPTAVDPVEAGASARGALESKIGEQHEIAHKEYGQLWKREEDPANIERVQVGWKTEEVNGEKVKLPVYEDMGLPVAMKEARKKLKPVYDSITRSMPITKRRMSEGYLALENIMKARDFEPASIIDRDLSAIKAAARGADLPELRTLSQGLAAFGVKHLDEQVRAAVEKAKVFDGPAPAAAAPSATPASPAAATPKPAIEGKATPSTGAETTIKVPGESKTYKARYEVRELEDVQPSHNGETFQPNTKYQLKNDRNYNKGENQQKVVDWSTEEQFDPSYHITDNPDAVNGPIVIDSSGNALGGNGRGMILQRVFKAGKEGAAKYRGLLESKLDRFGIDPKTVEGMRQPVLVRVIDDAELGAPGAKANAITDFNKKGTAELTPSERAIADSRRVSPATLDDLSQRLEAAGKDATLAEVLDGKGGVETLQKLIDDGVISPQERAAFQSGDNLTKAGKERIHSLMLGRYFSDPAQLDTIAPAIRGKLERLAAPLATVESSKAWNLSPHIQDAIELTERAKNAGGTLDDFLKQGGLLVDQEYSPQAIALAKQLRDKNPNELVKSARTYAEHMHYADTYEGPGLFGDLPEPVSPADAFKDAFGVELPKGSTMEPTPRAKPKFASFTADDLPVTLPEPKRPTKSVGADALGELERGRAATREKYQAKEVLDAMRTEPREAFNQFIYSKDGSVEHLNAFARQAPDTVPKIGRGVLEDLLNTATKDGGWDKAKSVATKWESIGPKTKRILFNNPKLIEDLDSFFLIAKKQAEKANTSGTAYVLSIRAGIGLALYSPLTGVPLMIGSAALAKLMHSPRAMHAITEAMKMPVAAGKQSAAATIAANRVLKIVGDAAKPMPTARPAAGNKQEPTAPQSTASGR